MREICFKAICKDSGKWVEGSLINNAFVKNDGSACVYIFLPSKQFDSFDCIAEGVDIIEVDPETVCQWTGLYDSTKWQGLTESEREQWTRSGNMPSAWKGKRIFEGDIVYNENCFNCFTSYGNIEDEYPSKRIVSWKDDEARFGWRYMQPEMNERGNPSGLCFCKGNQDCFEIIGNIHDRKEGV